MASAAERAWQNHIQAHQTAKANGQPPPRPGDWVCPKCWPRVNNFASKNVCYRCGEPKPPLGTVVPEPTPEQKKSSGPKINFGVRGDSLLQTRADEAKAKKMRTFKTEFETEFWEIFGNCYVDYSISAGENINEVTKSITDGPIFDYLCVGVSIGDLMDVREWNKVNLMYPPTLDRELELLAVAMRSKAQGSMAWVGAPGEFWGRGTTWDTYMERARNTLRTAGLQVVPAETVNFVMNQMTLSNDGMHIGNMEHEKSTFAKAWATCLMAAASDPTWGRALEGEARQVEAESNEAAGAVALAMQRAKRKLEGRSRSPRR